MKILFIFPYPAGAAASQRFRFEQYFDAMRDKGIVFELHPFLSKQYWDVFYKKGYFVQKAMGLLLGTVKRIALLPKLPTCDYVFIHREAMPVGPPVFEWMVARVFKKKIIFDFDDAIWIANSSESNRFFSPLKFHSNFFKLCAYAYKISAGNEYLKNSVQAANKRVVINPTTIDMVGLHNRPHLHDNDALTIGWTGSHSTLKYLDDLFPVIRKLKQTRSFKFVVISDEMPKNNTDLIEFIPWKRQSEIEDLLRFNIGVMPLTHDPWSEGKCGFKALQYMALGIPALVSPIGVNTKIVDHDVNGFVCNDATDWERYIIKLLDDRDLVKTMGAAARKKVAATYSVQTNTPNFLHLFT